MSLTVAPSLRQALHVTSCQLLSCQLVSFALEPPERTPTIAGLVWQTAVQLAPLQSTFSVAKRARLQTALHS
jgi:hypothetical protein